ncbi:MAG TPA: MBL fold metallo-hydrolase [Syntrophales bacterium]|nr:MBL fold metallo-hydrolase [Syntrophales bacterium]HPQ45441.1 MBL fold metallo-hydrolase [Syntrophales bacterium]
MTEEILPNLYRTEIPLPNSPLKWLNSYIIRGDDRFLIIDTGFNREECLNAMNESLQKLGVDLDKTDFFITHLHIDHIGLLGALASENAKVFFNEPEAQRIYAAQYSWKDYWQKIMDVYIANGFDAEVVRKSMLSHPAHRYSSQRTIDFTVVNDGDPIEIGDFHFRCVSTPGHSPGHLCLYEEEKKILIAGDHILFDITPNISYWLDIKDSLGRYLASLEKVDALDVELVLTGHRRLVHDLHGRVRELQEHHRARLDEVMTALGDGEKNILQVAPHISWDITAKTWEEFPVQQQWFAFGEAMAHVKYLEYQGKVRSKNSNGTITYSLA